MRQCQAMSEREGTGPSTAKELKPISQEPLGRIHDELMI